MMAAMHVFLDTNILLDVIEHRHPHCTSSQAVLDACDTASASVFLAWHSLSNAYYVYSKKAGHAAAHEALKEALDVMTVVSTGQPEALSAMELGFGDLEDAMQAAAAEAAGADCIVTRDPSGYPDCPVTVLTPDQFLALVAETSRTQLPHG